MASLCLGEAALKTDVISRMILGVLFWSACDASTQTVQDAGAPPGPAWPVQSGDTWVMVGDSITAQGLYSDYLEAFAYARYPSLRFSVRGSGKNGDTYLSVQERFADTVATWRPTLVTVNLGMNDGLGWFLSQRSFGAQDESPVAALVGRIRGTGARPYLLSPSARDVYAGSDNWFLVDFTAQLAAAARRLGAPMANQFTALQTLWEANAPRDRCMRLRRGVAPYLATDFDSAAEAQPLLDLMQVFLGDAAEAQRFLDAPERDTLRGYFLAAQAGKVEARNALRRYLAERWVKLVDAAQPPYVLVGGDTLQSSVLDYVHPGPPGHLMMAAVLFKQLGGDPLASAVELDVASRTVLRRDKAQVSEVEFLGQGVRFRRLDQALPLPIATTARAALAVDQGCALGRPADLFGMNQYLLAVRALPAGRYRVLIDGEEVASASAAELAAGLNLGMAAAGPLARQGQAILAAVRKKEAEDRDAQGDAAIRAAAQPLAHQWEVLP